MSRRRFFAKAGEVRGEVEWTERAAAMIRAKEYRFHSPVFLHDKKMVVHAVTSAGLTNDPAMFMTALARAGASTERETEMDPKALREALGLAAEATDEQVIAAAKAATAAAGGLKTVAKAAGLDESASAGAIETAVKAAASAGGGNPDPSQFVPRAEFDRVSQRLNTVETERTEERATAAVDDAVKAGKIAPAQREWATAYAKSDAEGFAAYVKTAPAIVSEGSVMPAPQRAAAKAGIALPSERRIDQDRLDLHQRATARAAKDKISYVDAVALEEGEAA